MSKRWINTKQYTTIENSNTKYLISSSNGKCNYQTIPEGSTKKTLQWNSIGNVSYSNLSIPFGINGNISSFPISDIKIHFPSSASASDGYMLNFVWNSSRKGWQRSDYKGIDDNSESIYFLWSSIRSLSKSIVSALNNVDMMRVYDKSNNLLLTINKSSSSYWAFDDNGGNKDTCELIDYTITGSGKILNSEYVIPYTYN